MVAAGVIPIDKLTEVRMPVEVVASRVGRVQPEAIYNIRLPPPKPHEPANKPPTAGELLRCVCGGVGVGAKGWARPCVRAGPGHV